MSLFPSGSRALFTAALACTFLVTGVPGAFAVGGTPVSVSSTRVATLPAPTLDHATVKGDNVALLWTPAAGDRARTYGVYADGRFLHRTPDNRTRVYLASEGLNGRETYTIVGEGELAPDGTPLEQSPPSNGLRPVAPETLPAPVLTSVVREGSINGEGGRVTLTWTPSQSEQDDISYAVIVRAIGAPNGVGGLGSVVDQTTATFDADACGGVCPVGSDAVYTVVASDFTMAESPESNGMRAVDR